MPRERLSKLYTIYIINVYITSVDLKHVALYSP
jgi:hypothetical protein